MTKEISDTVAKILKDKKVIKALKENFGEDKGLLLGQIEYSDDIRVIILYGLALENQNSSQAKIFSYKLSPYTINEGHDFKLEDSLPEIPKGAIETNYPTSRTINQDIKSLLKNPKARSINYAPFLK